MKYRRILDKGDDEIIILTEDGGIATIRETDEIEVGDGRQTTIEWYDQSILEILQSPLPKLLTCQLEDLPKYLNDQGELVQEALKLRLSGEPVDCLFYYIFDWLSNNSHIYYEDSPLKFEDDSHIDICLRELIGDSAADHERDDTLFKEYFE
jgi:hypothetical protein